MPPLLCFSPASSPRRTDHHGPPLSSTTNHRPFFCPQATQSVPVATRLHRAQKEPRPVLLLSSLPFRRRRPSRRRSSMELITVAVADAEIKR
ncbi:hypothetical protein M0R45_004398 [Rubus argutus]|uniref:Uncharacterized protein n=1 Tax=Rubus argutus TaxID=59490 RepID=A0AAW1YJQ1_RUBAR